MRETYCQEFLRKKKIYFDNSRKRWDDTSKILNRQEGTKKDVANRIGSVLHASLVGMRFARKDRKKPF